MAKNIFQDSTSAIPKTPSADVTRIAFDQSEVGARKSHLPKASDMTNGNTIRHVGGKG